MKVGYRRVSSLDQNLDRQELVGVEKVFEDKASGKDTNRTVVTIVGDPMAVLESAFIGIKTASELIDMNKHQGTHPRIGATDVCPMIPVSEVSDEECINLTKTLGNIRKIYYFAH